MNILFTKFIIFIIAIFHFSKLFSVTFISTTDKFSLVFISNANADTDMISDIKF